MEQVFYRARVKAELARLHRMGQQVDAAIWQAEQSRLHEEYMRYARGLLASGSAKSAGEGDWWIEDGTRMMLKREW